MEISKLTICRQEVIVVSDTESNTETNLKKKKKSKRNTECVRKVELTKTIINRIVPHCYRKRCRHGPGYHKQTTNNIKYWKGLRHSKWNGKCPMEAKYREGKPYDEKKSYQKDKNDNLKHNFTRNLYSPITIASSNTFETISSCSLNIMSSDSDELEDLIKLTRKRMNSDNFNNNCNPLNDCAETTMQYDQQMQTSDEVHNSSFHSVDTAIICPADTAALPINSEYYDPTDPIQNYNNYLEPICSSPEVDAEGMSPTTIVLPNQDNKGNLSPLYEISGKIFMEHYLNTSSI